MLWPSSIVERTITMSSVARAQVQHERLVDLQFVDRQALQVRERGVAGAEVVDGQAQPRRLQIARIFSA
jgi:hypothetical protein